VCVHCSVRFYDLRKKLIQCPNCGADYEPHWVSKANYSAHRKQPSAIDIAVSSDIDDAGDVEDLQDFDDVIGDAVDDIEDDVLAMEDDNTDV